MARFATLKLLLVLIRPILFIVSAFTVFLLCIRSHISMSTDAWNMHPLQTENNFTPLHLWANVFHASLSQRLHRMNDHLLETPTEMAELRSQYYLLGPCDDLSINMYLNVL